MKICQSTHLRNILVILITGLFFIPTMTYAAGYLPVMESTSTPPIHESNIASAVLIDTNSGEFLYSYHPGMVWTPASLTKLMTSRVWVTTPTKWEGNASIVKADEVGGGRLQVVSGSTMTFRDILYSALIGSANNCAEAMGRMFDGKGKTGFISRMNDMAARLGMVQTHYNDASGMNEKNTSSAYDTAIVLTSAADADPEVEKAMSLPTYTFDVKKPVVHKLIKSTNDLLFSQSDLVITAGKTGYLVESKYNFAVRAYPKGHPEKQLVAVILGADNRAISQDDALAMMRWAWDSYTWKNSTSTVNLTENRESGAKGDDVKRLQQYLNTHGFLIAKSGSGSPGKETTLFGELTKDALIRYQEAHADEILKPHGATKGSGYLDYYTRSAINRGL